MIHNTDKKLNKKWNWSACPPIIVLCLIGAVGNQHYTIGEDFVLGLVIGVPVAIMFAYLGRQ